jgi:predicted transposase YdaD
VGDNIVAILTRLPDERAAVRRIVERIADLPAGEREAAFEQLFILAGLRRLGQVIQEEAKKMPILTDILDHDVIGPEYRRGVKEGLEEGIQQGVQQGIQQGVQQGELKVLRRQIEKRFGPIPAWAEERLASRTAIELEDLGVRALDAVSLEDLLG